jgi:hypothetical protein
MSRSVSRAIVGVLALALGLATSGCGSEGAAEARPSGSAPAKASPPSPVGSWVFDVDGYVEENWELLAKAVAPAVTAIRREQERIQALPPDERADAERLLRERLTEKDREIHSAALGGPERVKEFARGALRKQLGSARLDIEFAADGTCSLALDVMVRSSSARGTWTQEGADVTVRMTTVDGKPAPARDREPKTLTLRGDRLHIPFGPGAPVLVAKRG